MTVSSVIPVNNYVGNGSTKIFDFDFLIENANELVVTHVSETDVATVLINGIDYSINEIGNVNGSYIVFPLSGSNFGILERNQAISLTLDLEIKQESKFENSSYLNLSILEWTFDYIIRILQILNRKIERSVKIREGSSYTPDSLIETLTLYKEESRKNAQIAKEYAQEAKSVIEENVSWGKIYGNIQNQNDLNQLLSKKADINLCNEIIQNKIYQSSAKETGVINSDTDIYSDISQYAHSTFDLSKFTVVGSVNITDDGIASGFSKSNYIKAFNSSNFSSKPFELYFSFDLSNITTRQTIIGSAIPIGFNIGVQNGKMIFGASSNKIDLDIASNVLSAKSINSNNKYLGRLIWNGVLYNLDLNIDGQWVNYISVNNSLAIASDVLLLFGTINYIHPLTQGSIDIKQFVIRSNGQPVFNGNITGTDTYTINEEETQIPYTLSKTGSKIVDVAYRDKVQALYQEQGYAPYYTIDEQNQNFTLPMGEVYGMIERKLDAEKTPHVIEKFVDGKSGYRLYSDGYCEQWGFSQNATTTSFIINLLKTYIDVNYLVFVSLGGLGLSGSNNIAATPTSVSSITISANDYEREQGIYWRTLGYTNLEN